MSHADTGEPAGVSVLMPVRDGSAFVRESIESALDQTRPPDEVVVVDDGSTDGTRRIVSGFPAPVRLVRQPALGLEAARNRCVAEASFGLLAFLDSDDLWPRERLHVLCAALEQTPHASVVQGRLQRFREVSGKREFEPEAAAAPSLCTALIRKDLFAPGRVGPLNEDLESGGDVDWWLRLQRSGDTMVLLDAVTLFYRRHEGNMSNDLEAEKRAYLEVVRLSVARRRTERR